MWWYCFFSVERRKKKHKTWYFQHGERINETRQKKKKCFVRVLTGHCKLEHARKISLSKLALLENGSNSLEIFGSKWLKPWKLWLVNTPKCSTKKPQNRKSAPASPFFPQQRIKPTINKTYLGTYFWCFCKPIMKSAPAQMLRLLLLIFVHQWNATKYNTNSLQGPLLH